MKNKYTLSSKIINRSHTDNNAIIYCDSFFGHLDGKTANGLVRKSKNYNISAVIDRTKAGLNAGEVLDGILNEIPIYKDIEEAVKSIEGNVATFIIGMAPASGRLSDEQRSVVLKAISLGMNIVNGLHEFLSDDPIFIDASNHMKVQLIDIRKPPPRNEMNTFTGKINEITSPRIAIMGTDCAVGKRTTAVILEEKLKNEGINAVLISTGQTGLIQGAKYGICLDSIPSQFCAGQLESEILRAYQCEKPDIFIIEGQGALSHPAYSTSSFILRGSCPDAFILQHSPKRAYRCDFPNMLIPSLESEINLIQTFCKATVLGITLNSEHMQDYEVDQSILEYKKEFNLPVCNPLTDVNDELLNMVKQKFHF